jgi:hypothetical protein
MAGNSDVRCQCPRCTIRSLRGPAVVITLGILFLLSEMRGDYFAFHNTWPMILIVLGLMSLASAVAPMDGHVVPAPPVAPGVPPRPSGAPPAVPPSPYTGPRP